MLQPIRCEDAAAVLASAAEAALRPRGEDDPSVALDSQGLAGSVDVGQDCAAKLIVDSVGEIDSFAVVERIIELLAHGVVLLLVADDAHIETDLVGVVENRRGFAEADCKEKEHGEKEKLHCANNDRLLIYLIGMIVRCEKIVIENVMERIGLKKQGKTDTLYFALMGNKPIMWIRQEKRSIIKSIIKIAF